MPDVTLTKSEVIVTTIAIEERINRIRYLLEHLPLEDYETHVFYELDIAALQGALDKLAQIREE